mmetsp:Transcript_59730/g.123954  ORF Transcript_59730/g.123954 Transcript_59730/m.123954 type:complete len:237 (-) Transcript_59730:231-941(-)
MPVQFLPLHVAKAALCFFKRRLHYRLYDVRRVLSAQESTHTESNCNAAGHTSRFCMSCEAKRLCGCSHGVFTPEMWDPRNCGPHDASIGRDACRVRGGCRVRRRSKAGVIQNRFRGLSQTCSRLISQLWKARSPPGQQARCKVAGIRMATGVQERLHHQNLLVGVVGPIPCTPHHSVFIWEHSPSRPKVCVFSVELFCFRCRQKLRCQPGSISQSCTKEGPSHSVCQHLSAEACGI